MATDTAVEAVGGVNGHTPEMVAAPAPAVEEASGSNGAPRLSRQQQRALARKQATIEQEQRTEALRQFTHLQRPPTRAELHQVVQGFEQRLRERDQQWTAEVQRYRAMWDEMRLAFNHLSVRHEALQRSLLAQRVWGKPVLAEADYQRALGMVEQELRAQAEAEQARARAAAEAGARAAQAEPPPAAEGGQP